MSLVSAAVTARYLPKQSHQHATASWNNRQLSNKKAASLPVKAIISAVIDQRGALDGKMDCERVGPFTLGKAAPIEISPFRET